MSELIAGIHVLALFLTKFDPITYQSLQQVTSNKNIFGLGVGISTQRIKSPRQYQPY